MWLGAMLGGRSLGYAIRHLVVFRLGLRALG
jgi:hypothetical protein